MRAAKLTILIIFVLTSCTNYLHVPGFMSSESIKWKKSDKVYILLRHAEKKSGEDPHLKAEGFNRATLFAELMKNTPVKEIFSTNYNRTIQTVTPLANAINQELTIYNPRGLGDFSKELDAKPAGVYVISGHSNTTPTLANDLCNCTEYPNIDESDYSNIFVVVSNSNGTKAYQLTY